MLSGKYKRLMFIFLVPGMRRRSYKSRTYWPDQRTITIRKGFSIMYKDAYHPD